MFFPVLRVYSTKAASKMARNCDDDVSAWELEGMMFGRRMARASRGLKSRREDLTGYTGIQCLPVDTAKRPIRGSARRRGSQIHRISSPRILPILYCGGRRAVDLRRPEVLLWGSPPFRLCTSKNNWADRAVQVIRATCILTVS